MTVPKTLVVDDNAGLPRFITAILANEGYEIVGQSEPNLVRWRVI